MSTAWTRAISALKLLAIDPGLGGIWLRARVGPPRDAFICSAKSSQRHWTPISPTITDEALFGGTDISLTLALGKLHYFKGLLSSSTTIALASAQRTPAELAARLGQALDGSGGFSLIALDEGIEEERAPEGLTDRLAFHVSLDTVSASDCEHLHSDIDVSAPHKNTVSIQDADIHALVSVAANLGVAGLRAPLFAIRAAKASAILNQRSKVTSEDLELAATLVLGPRATIAPMDEPPPADQPETSPDDSSQTSKQSEPRPPEDMLLEAALASLPHDLLAKLSSGKSPKNASGHSTHGSKKKGSQRGRPLSSRKGKPDGRHRIDLMATLRAAAPWQTVRNPQNTAGMVQIRREDIHIRRYQSRSDRLLVFVVDASGSAAINRLAEAKGAVELLLAQAYANRDHVALISYNKQGAELLLPPTRSLVQTKRRLARLPGGGGTPLAAGLQQAFQSAELAKRKGLQPAVVVIADGRTNIDLSGVADRSQALEDAMNRARVLRGLDAPSIVVDMSKRPEPQLQKISAEMAATYLPLPHVDSRGLSNVVSKQLGPQR